MFLNDAGPVSGMASILLAAGPCGKNNQELPWDTALPKKRCLELSGTRDSSVYWVGRVPDTFFWAKPWDTELSQFTARGLRNHILCDSISANGGKTHGPQSNHHYPRP